MPEDKTTMRPDRWGEHRRAFERNSRKIIKTQEICGICGKPVDKSLRYPNPMAASVDHIIPVARGGHPSDIDNLQLAHWTCNRQKSDKLMRYDNRNSNAGADKAFITNRNLPQSRDWTAYIAADD